VILFHYVTVEYWHWRCGIERARFLFTDVGESGKDWTSVQLL